MSLGYNLGAISVERGERAVLNREPGSEHLFECDHDGTDHYHMAAQGWAAYKDRSHAGVAPRLRQRAEELRTNTFGHHVERFVARDDELTALRDVQPDSTRIRVRFPDADLAK